MASLRGGPGTADAELITASGITLQGLVAAAYGVLSEQVSGPSWIAEARYVLVAKVLPGTTKEQANLMLQKALAERFKLALHRGEKEFQIWELVIAKEAPKLTEAADHHAQPQMKGQAREGIQYDRYRAFRISKTDQKDSEVSLDKI